MSTPVEHIPDIVKTLQDSYKTGKTKSLSWRKAQLTRLIELVENEKDALASAMAVDLGRTSFFSDLVELAAVAKEARAAIASLKEWTEPERPSLPLINKLDSSGEIRKEPLGVALIIAPFNFPVSLLLKPLVGALAAGNCVCLKPSEVAVETNKVLGDAVRKYMDPRFVAVVQGAVPETTELLKCKFDIIMYTGNGAVARIIMAAAAESLTPVLLELGGKSPCYIDKSANVDVAAHRVAFGKFLNCGQVCVAPDYVLVHPQVKDEFIAKFQQVIKDFYGENPQLHEDYMRMVNVRHTERVKKLIEASGEPLIGGAELIDVKDRYIPPTIFVDPSEETPIMKEEIFGPVLPILTKDLASSIQFINARNKPLALYVFAEDKATVDAVIDQTSAGGMAVNETIMHVGLAELPFGGVGESGTGAYNGKHSFNAFSHSKSILRKNTRMNDKTLFPPYTDKKKKTLGMILYFKLPSYVKPIFYLLLVALIAFLCSYFRIPERGYRFASAGYKAAMSLEEAESAVSQGWFS